jgi:hypothetical protein
MSVVVLLILVIATISNVMHVEFSDNPIEVNGECFLTILPLNLYKPAFFLTACIMVLFTSSFFVLPVLYLS